MSNRKIVDYGIQLHYHEGPDDPERGIFYGRPVEPEFTTELRVGAHLENVDPDPPPDPLTTARLQIELSGTSRALESLGTFLIALARLDTRDPHPHEHIEDVRHESGATVHLIVRRQTSPDMPSNAGPPIPRT